MGSNFSDKTIYKTDLKQSRVSNVTLCLMGMHASLQQPNTHAAIKMRMSLMMLIADDLYRGDGGVYYTSKLICKTPSNYATDAHRVHCMEKVILRP